MTRLWHWVTIALGSAEARLGLGFALMRLREDAGAAWLDAEVERLLVAGAEEGEPG
ncbi:hypothetical protein ACFVIM_10540 [Streptomyces sp. NPDC057638]|uniref:hypothetical protein n=1 Tax=Streptomyces sp. NPDC057638 TaxID=3346190 RepID=UPI0036A50DBD